MQNWIQRFMILIGILFFGGSVFLLASSIERTDSRYSFSEGESREEVIEESVQDNNSMGEEINYKNGTTSEFFSFCGYLQEGDTYTVSAGCILQGKLPHLEMKEVVDLLWEEIIGFDEVYMPFVEEHVYDGAVPLFDQPFDSLLNGSTDSNKKLLEYARGNQDISFSKKELARALLTTYRFYVSDKTLSELGPCTRNNYKLAMDTMDGYLFRSGESFNANHELRKIKSYCTGRGENNFLFYGGVCGMTAQLFRISLLTPGIEITKRHPHSEWFVQYYGENIGGDDAAIYEMSKQFEINNASTYDIYFRVKWDGDQSFLVAISPTTNQRVQIKKTPISERSIKLERIVSEHSINSTSSFFFQQDNLGSLMKKEEETNIVRHDVFDSRYYKKNHEYR